MTKINIIGKIRPEPFKCTIPPRDIEWADGNFAGKFKIRIADSIVNIECEPLNEYSSNITLLVIRAFDLARAHVNLIAFATGQGLTVEFEYILDPIGTPSYLISNNLPVARHCTSYKINNAKSINEMYEIVVGTPDVARCLNDLIQSITTPHVSPTNCGRAVDGIKHLISGNIRDEPKAWRTMRDALNVDEGYLKFITSASTDPRHGRPGYTPPDVTDKIVTRAWILMDRFLEYKKRGDKPLPRSKFPLLK